MNPKEFPKSERREVMEKMRVVVDTPQQAAALVEEFWLAMSHGSDLVRAVRLDDPPDWLQTLTSGDRTLVKRGSRDETGKTIVLFMGNNQSLSREAETWLKNKGYGK